MSDVAPLYLTKSDFVTGLDCPKRLWLSKRAHRLGKPLSDADRDRIRTGSIVGDLARGLYQHGVFVGSKGLPVEEAAAKTVDFMRTNDSVFEATFVADGCMARVDILRRHGSGWAIDEVKSSTVKKPDALMKGGKIHDVAFQYASLRRGGLPVEQARLVLLDSTYIWPGGDYALPALFKAVDVTQECQQLEAQINSQSAEFAAVLKSDVPPEIETNTHCKGCNFHEHCHQGQHKWDVVFLPEIRRVDVSKLRANGYPTIDTIPEDYRMPESRSRVRKVIVTGEPYISADLSDRLQELKLPAAFVDFETSATALPVYPGTHPYQPICFQWSAHVIDESGMHHREFLHEGNTDPREAFCESLYECVEDCQSIVHYTPFEVTQLKDMAASGIPLGQELRDLFALRSYDLYRIVAKMVYFEEFRASASIKQVLPVLVPAMNYNDMVIADGLAAALGFREMVAKGTPEERREVLRQALLEYCAQDTLAMVAIYDALCQLVDVRSLTSQFSS